MSENKMPTGFERGDLFAPRSALIDSKDEVEQAYVLLLQAKTQIEADEQEIVRLTAERIQFSNDILSLLSEFGYATPEKGYDSPSLVLSDLRDCMSKLRNGAIAEYQLRVKAERGGRHGRIKSGD